ncbi:hypothetical protein [Ktedonobacter robiniae]|uniref:hypothetical protein n=1 Tax=Ktedonobacter robiniae TaxID=2778365 RepID=UPI0019159F70|nr:hypothetical protein [Ktedonobacter robiniae]
MVEWQDVAHARSAEQAMPPGPTLDRGDQTRRERERSGDDGAPQCRTLVALGESRSVSPVKGDIARAPGLQRRRRRECFPIYLCLHSFTLLDSITDG